MKVSFSKSGEISPYQISLASQYQRKKLHVRSLISISEAVANEWTIAEILTVLFVGSEF
jgi:hypothetical protein